MAKSLLFFSFSLVFLWSYNTGKRIKNNAAEEIPFTLQLSNILNDDSLFINSYTGLVVKDLVNGEEIFNHKGSHYFTPASNTKLLTFYTSLKVLGDQISGVKYYETDDTIIIWGTGDPSFLNPNFFYNDFISEEILSKEKPVFLSTSNFHDKKFGSGWSWDDHNYAYQCEKNALPVYGNLIHASKPEMNSELSIEPKYFLSKMSPNLNPQAATFMRALDENKYQYDKLKLDTINKVNRNLPFKADPSTIAELLSEHWNMEVRITDQIEGLKEAKTIMSIESDSLYQQMLHPSDNFVAEQLLLNCGSVLFDSLNTRKVIEWSMDSLLKDMPHKYQWVDGSGLSRYNMTTPENMVFLLELIYSEVNEERLFELLPTGGESGTIRNLYKAEKPFIHAKTGSLRNNHSLSGYLIGDSGKVYVFSLMNSNFIRSSSEMKKGMDRILRILKEHL